MASRAARGGGGGGRAPGKRARVGEPSSRIPSVPGYEGIVFAHHTQRSRFINLEGIPMNPTRFLSRNAMITLGLDDMMRNLFAGTGLRTLYGMQELTYRNLTLEFLSSLSMNKDTYEVSFRIQNEGYSLSLADFGNYFGLARSPISRAPDAFSGHDLWDCMSNRSINNFTNVRVNNIQHPAIRIWFRTVIGTIFGRGEVGTLNFTELSLLGSYLNVQRGDRFALDLPYLVVKHMIDVAETRIRSIEMGGLITFLLKAMGFDFGNLVPYVTDERWIDIDYLRTGHKWIQRSARGIYRWKIAKDPIDRFIVLPSDRLPALYTLRAGEGNGLPSYLIHEDMIVERGEQPPRRSRSTREEASSSNPPPTHHEIYMNHLHHTNQRFTHDAVNRNLEGYWQYHNAVESGVAQGPHPSYYRGANTSGIFEEAGIDPNAWGPDYHRSYGGFGGQFLDEFGRLNVGGGGNGGGNDGGNDDSGDDEY